VKGGGEMRRKRKKVFKGKKNDPCLGSVHRFLRERGKESPRRMVPLLGDVPREGGLQRKRGWMGTNKVPICPNFGEKKSRKSQAEKEGF